MSASSFIQQLAEVLLDTRGSLAGGDRIGLDEAVERSFALLMEAKRGDRCVFAVGNGGSQVVAQHVEMDLCNRAGMRSRSFSSTPVITALCNDHSHNEAYARLVRSQGRAGDVLIAVSSSGASPNIVNAARAAREMQMPVITFSGFDAGNALRREGDLNFWIDSNSYSLVELAHETLVHHLSDLCVEAEEDRREGRIRPRAGAERPAAVTVLAKEPASRVGAR